MGTRNKRKSAQGVIDEEILHKIKKLDTTDNKSWLCSTLIAQAEKIEKYAIDEEDKLDVVDEINTIVTIFCKRMIQKK